MFNFKKFEGVHQKIENRITVTRSHSIGLPTKFSVDNAIKSFKYVTLYWDEGNKAIGIHFTNDEAEKDKLSIMHNDKYGGGIGARNFFRANNIDPKIYYGRYNWEIHEMNGVGKLYVIKLKVREEKK